MPKQSVATRKPLTAMMTRDWQRIDGDEGGEAVTGNLVVVCDDGAVFAYSWMDGGWGELDPIPGSRRETIKTREDAKEKERAEKALREGLDAWQKRTTAKRAAE